MQAYATVEDLEARWRTLDDDEKAKAETLLGDATTHIRALINQKRGDKFEPDELMQENLKVVCCNIVMRSMNAKQSYFGMSEVSATAGPYSQTFTPINSSGDMRLTDEEMRLLGLKGQRGGFAYPYKCGGNACVHNCAICEGGC